MCHKILLIVVAGVPSSFAMDVEHRGLKIMVVIAREIEMTRQSILTTEDAFFFSMRGREEGSIMRILLLF